MKCWIAEYVLWVPQILSLGSGLLSGVLISVPITGPMGVYITVQGLRGEVREGVVTAAGTAVVETIYCFLAFLGMSYLSGWKPLMEFLFIAGTLLIMYLGFQQWAAGTASAGFYTPQPWLRSQGNFFIGFFITAINPGILLSWIIILAVFTEYGISFTYPADLFYAVGVGAGSVGWFYVYLHLLRKVRSRIRPQWFDRMVKGLSLLIMGIGFFMLCSRFWMIWKS